MSSATSTPIAGKTSVMRGRPSVSVPVLSNARASSEPSISSGPPPLINTPPRAARATPDKPALGVAMASAQEIGRAHVLTPVTNAQLLCRHLTEKQKKQQQSQQKTKQRY